MERHEILDAMSELKLYGMRASFDEIAGKGLARRDEVYPLIASLIRAERTHRQARSISYRISGAKFPVLKDLDSFVFADTPVDQGQVRELATGTFLDAKRNGIFIGGKAVAELVALQADYAHWLDALPDATRDGATAEALQAIVDLDLDDIIAAQPPRGFGRD